MAAQAGPGPRQSGSLEQRLEERAVIPILSLGLITNGSGSLKYDCDSSGGAPPCNQISDSDYDEKSDFAIGADLLFRVVPKFRLGLGLQWIPTPSVESQQFYGNNDEQKSGHEVDATVVAEGVFPVTDTLGLYVRGQAGVALLFAGGDHEDTIDDLKQACTAASSTNVECEANEGPFVGPTFGLGFGVVLLVGDAVNLRAGIAAQLYNIPYIKNKISGGSASYEQTLSADGSRGLLIVGAEL